MRERALEFYRRVITDDFLQTMVAHRGAGTRAGIFESTVVIWLMIFQRLSPDRTLAAALNELKSGSSTELLSRKSGSIRARTGRISGSTGAYAQGRKRVGLEVIERVADELNTSIISTHREQRLEDRKVYVIDGSTLRIDHSAENLKKYPVTTNQHGDAHYPLLRIVIATDLVTGVALRPSFGPYAGREAIDELGLADELFPRIPVGSVLIGDRCYGCFRFAYCAKGQGHDVIVRMKEINAKRFIGKTATDFGECVVNWTPSPKDPKKYANFPIDAAVQGRMIWYTIKEPGFRPVKLFFFTTLTFPVGKIAELYGLRWKIETDLRDIKSTMKMDAIHAKTPAMIAKEIILGVTAYNLVRHIMAVVAHQAKVDPRSLSFSLFLKRIRALGNSTLTGVRLDKALVILLSDISGLSIAKRKKRRLPEPRKIWPKGEQHFMNGSREQQRTKIRAAILTTSLLIK